MKGYLGIIDESIEKLENYIELNNYSGFDPYDGLNSPIFKLPILKSNKLIRFSFQQFLKRFPLNLRSFFYIKPGLNPVTIGLAIQAYSYLSIKNMEDNEKYISKIKKIINILENHVPIGYSGACWGYNFDWEARNMKIPSFQPTIVATGIICNALFVAYKITKIKKAKEMILSASNFVQNDLNISYEDKNLCFSYSPFDNQKVFNASMKAARLLSQTYYFNNDSKLITTIRNVINFVINHQNDDGSWYYSLANKGNWVDNYHTGYIIDCIEEYQKISGDYYFKNNIEKGYKYYFNNFFTKNFISKFYNNKLYPIDVHHTQSIMTLVRFSDEKNALKVASWMIKNMRKSDGSFIFRRHKYYKQKTSYMRWSNAWMFAALSYLRSKI